MKKVNDFFTMHKSANLFLLLLLLAITFIASFSTIFKVHYDELQGTHSWLSGSTIKFVNNWLEETPQKLHFVNYESPDSIEFNETTERGPYISYPSGCTLFVYFAAKIVGRNTIGISFLKHFQMICFLLEVLLFGLFVYRFLGKSGIESVKEKLFVSFATATFWSWLPTNVWYLANVYFADQCIILFVMAFLLVEYECYYCEKKSLSISLNFIKSILILCGVLIDYYFWILAFVAFIFQIVITVKSEKSIGHIIINSLWYAIPVILALGFYAYQLFSVPNWKSILFAKFEQRAGLVKTDTGPGVFNTPKFIIKNLIRNFIYAFGLKENLKVLPLLLLVLYLFVKKADKSEKKSHFVYKEIIFSKNGIIIILGVISPILQILLLKNHSAIHEFSQIKLSWIFAMFPLVVSLISVNFNNYFEEKIVYLGKIKISYFLNLFIISFLCIAFLTAVPFSSWSFRKSRMEEYHDYHLAEILKDNTSFEHVCFSFSYEIPNNPPQELAISRKQVYKINSKEELESYFPNLKENAKKIFVIDKTALSTLTNEQIESQLDLQSSNVAIYEDDQFCLLEICSDKTSVLDK
ncbi:hypothetical protein HO345_11865 [Treponema denticola]|uniref:hypothetical protein n=1 Tax=Treponema denticola TaxID=158 RepID=UPI0020A3554E|nr:hypothetical protein [Treponema denticola]UTD13618.1 hypothetical protein HO345_11865 [Treponema denticola]